MYCRILKNLDDLVRPLSLNCISVLSTWCVSFTTVFNACFFAKETSFKIPKLHWLSMFAVKAKNYGVLYNQSSSITFDETSSYWSVPKAPYFSPFHWSPHGSLDSIGQHFVTRRVVHLMKRTKTSLITEADLIAQLDQAVRVVQSCRFFPWDF